MSKTEVTTTDFTKEKAVVDTVRNAVFPTATDSELMLYFHKCQTVGTHPLSGMIHPVKFKQPDQTFRVSFIVSIDLLRSRSNNEDYDGEDQPEYEGEIDFEYQEDVWENGKRTGSVTKNVVVPEKAVVKVYRKSITRPFVGEARWVEFYPGDKKGHQWRNKPYLMLAKCAEAQARRKAFPQELNQLYTAEEMERTTEMLAQIAPISSKPSVTPDQVNVSSQGSQQAYSNAGNSTDKIPTDEERKNGKLISENQAKLMYVKCKENGVNPVCVAKASNVQNIHWLTWANNCKTNFEVMLNLVQTKPNSFSKFEPAAQEAKAAAQPEESPTPEMMGDEEFQKLAFTLSLGCGMTEAQLDSALEAEFSIKGVKNVKAADQNKVIDYLTTKSEQAGA